MRALPGHVELGRLDDDPLLQVADRLAGRDAELVVEHLAQPTAGAKRVHGPTAAVEREHQPLDERLAHRMVADLGREQLAHPSGLVDREVRVGEELDRVEAEVLEPDHLAVHRLERLEVLVRRAPPQPERPAEVLDRFAGAPPCTALRPSRTHSSNWSTSNAPGSTTSW